jgi:hypothetical protein
LITIGSFHLDFALHRPVAFEILGIGTSECVG